MANSSGYNFMFLVFPIAHQLGSVVIGLDPLSSGERGFDAQWCERSQHGLRHSVVDLDGADVEAVEAAFIFDPLAGAVITRRGGAAGVMGAQLASAVSADGKTLQQGRDRSPSLVSCIFVKTQLTPPQKLASQMRTAFSSIVANTGSRSPGKLLITCRTSEVAACRSDTSFNSRVSRATFVSSRLDGVLERGTAFGALLRFGPGPLRRRTLICSPPALERRFIASPRRLRAIVAGRRVTFEVAYARVRLINHYNANSASNAFASFRSRVSNPSVNQP